MRYVSFVTEVAEIIVFNKIAKRDSDSGAPYGVGRGTKSKLTVSTIPEGF